MRKIPHARMTRSYFTWILQSSLACLQSTNQQGRTRRRSRWWPDEI